MGLDMCLTGREYIPENWDNPEKNEKIDGLRLKSINLELGYWRKHPDLHGFIVQTFAEGKDECQEIELDAKALATILKAVKAEKLPHTEGFFFGESRAEDKAATIEIIRSAIRWLKKSKPGVYKSVIYRASW